MTSGLADAAGWFYQTPCHLVTMSPCNLVTLSPCPLATLSPCQFVTFSPCKTCEPCWNVCLIVLLCCLALGCSQGDSNKCSVQVWGWLHISLSGLSIARPRRSGSAQTKDLDWIFSVANPTDSELTSQTDRSGIHLIYGGAQAPAKKYAKIR